MSEQIRIKYYVRTDMVGSTCEDVLEMPRSEWEAMSEQDREEMMRELAFNSMDWGYREIPTGESEA
ncbi:hypothetical protein [Marinobacter sp. P4B1]|uniref:DUF7167 family protein n=1 Tax=Marinobacter sp. P4B1 TaxID=1119533 RepID=UPI00071E0B4C|nr:hypothetical protein [Marinobacter sp. P4B1]KRW83645.1 hypothetical protein AQ621_16485 [Marinobacter sp. P4B1]